jgi:hypothetical protein
MRAQSAASVSAAQGQYAPVPPLPGSGSAPPVTATAFQVAGGASENEPCSVATGVGVAGEKPSQSKQWAAGQLPDIIAVGLQEIVKLTANALTVKEQSAESRSWQVSPPSRAPVCLCACVCVDPIWRCLHACKVWLLASPHTHCPLHAGGRIRAARPQR